MKPRPDRSDRNVHDLGDFFVAQLLHFSKDECSSQFGRQLGQKFLDNDTILDHIAGMRLYFVEFCKFWSLKPESIHA
jgi:hypothetical protein